MARHRSDRINEEVMRATAEIIRDLKDPRIPLMTSVVRAEVTPDLKYAKIYISVMGDAQQTKDCLKGLKSAAGFIRREVGRRVTLRAVPEFHFVADDSITRGARIAQMLKGLDLPSEEETAEPEAPEGDEV